MQMFAIYDCDRWHRRDTMRLITIADGEHLTEVLLKIQEIREYTNEEMRDYIHTDIVNLNEVY